MKRFAVGVLVCFVGRMCVVVGDFKRGDDGEGAKRLLEHNVMVGAYGVAHQVCHIWR